MSESNRGLLFPPYDGTTDVNSFIKQFSLYCISCGWNDVNKLAVLPFVLKSKAERVFNVLATEKKSNIADALKEIRAACSQSQDTLLEAYFDRKPTPGEKISSFAFDLQSLLKRAIPTMESRERGILLRRQLGTFLPAHMRAIISFNSNKTWDELLQAIDQSMPHVKAHATADDSSFGIFASAGDMAVKAEPVEANATSANRGKFEGLCHYCKLA